MRVEIDTKDLVELVKQFTTKFIPDEDILADIEDLLTNDYELFSEDVDIVEF